MVVIKIKPKSYLRELSDKIKFDFLSHCFKAKSLTDLVELRQNTVEKRDGNVFYGIIDLSSFEYCERYHNGKCSGRSCEYTLPCKRAELKF